MRSIFKWSLLPGLLLTGCLAEGTVGYQATVVAPQPVVAVDASAEVVEAPYVEPASYVYVAPEVQVIEGYDEPVFYNSGLYWRYDNNVWYSSSYHDRGWGESREVPEHIRSIDRPQQYVHYQGNVNAHVGEVGYVDRQPVHPVHSAPPPHYVERPPATRGGTNYRPTPQQYHPAGGGNSYKQPAPTHTEPTHTYEPAHNQPAPTHTEPTHTYEPTHNEPAKPAEPTHTYEPAHNEPAKPAEPTHTYEPAHNTPAPTHTEPTHTYEPAHNTPAPTHTEPTHTYTPAKPATPAPKPAPKPYVEPKKKK